MTDPIRAEAERLADKMLTDGFGRKANRLIMFSDGKDMGCGWGKEAIADQFEIALIAAERRGFDRAREGR